MTFDFWNTLYRDDAEVSRARNRMRAGIIADAAPLGGAGPRDEYERRIVELLPAATALRDGSHHGFTTAERIAWLLGELGVSLAPEALEALSEEVSGLGLVLRPVPVEGVRGVVEAVSAVARTGVVSDTGLMSGRCLRSVMETDGLAGRFGALGFSDETGRMKPHAGAFLPVLGALGVAPEEAVHVGDLARTDVAGALALGMRAIWIGDGRPESDLAGIARADDARLVRVGSLVEVPAALRALGLG